MRYRISYPEDGPAGRRALRFANGVVVLARGESAEPAFDVSEAEATSARGKGFELLELAPPPPPPPPPPVVVTPPGPKSKRVADSQKEA